MEKIKIVMINSLAPIKLFLDRFVASLRIGIHHIDYATDRVGAYLYMEAKLFALNVERSVVNATIRFPTMFSHVDYTESSLTTHMKMQAKIRSIDNTIAQVRAQLTQYISVKHVDYDKSRMGAVLVYPITLGSLSDMTLGEMANVTMSELTFREIDI